MRRIENLEMEPDQLSEDNVYANTSDLDVRRRKNTPKAKVIPPIGSKKHRVILILGVLLILAFLILFILTSLLFINYSSMVNRVTEIESSLKRLSSDKTIASLSSNIQRISGVLGNVTEYLQKSNWSHEPLCSEGWKHYGLSCYYLSSNSQSWSISKKDCEDRKAHLVVINGKGEMNFLRGVSKDKYFWIGLTDEDGTWKWVDGTSYDITPKFWKKDQPDEWTGHGLRRGEDCAEMGEGYDWNDDHCSLSYRYICEKFSDMN